MSGSFVLFFLGQTSARALMFGSRNKTHVFLRTGCIVGEKILKITGTWMEKENYPMHGQASQDSLY